MGSFSGRFTDGTTAFRTLYRSRFGCSLGQLSYQRRLSGASTPSLAAAPASAFAPSAATTVPASPPRARARSAGRGGDDADVDPSLLRGVIPRTYRTLHIND